MLALELDRDGVAGAEPPEVRPLNTDVLAYDRRFAVLGDIKPKDDGEVHYYAISRAAGSAVRIKKLLDDWRATLPADRTLLLHAGDIAPTDATDDAARGMCADTLRGEHVDGAVPRDTDLALGPAALTAFAARAGVPFLAANLRDQSGARPLPRYRIIEEGGATIAVIGLVGSKRLASLATAVRAQWRVDPPAIALDDTVTAIHDQLRRWPDLTFLLSSAEDEPDLDLARFGKIDVVVTARGITDLVEHVEDVKIKDREHFRGQVPALVAAMPGYTLSHIEARLGAPLADGRRALTEVVQQNKAVLDGDAQDFAFKKTFRAVEERAIARDAEVILPDPDPFIRAHPELASLVWGDRVLYERQWTKIDPTWSPFVTDPLWMQLVTNAIKSELHTEVALAVNLKRSDDLLGALGRFVFEDWLSSPDAVLRAKLTGSELMQIAARIAKQDVDGAVAPRDFLFAAGLDAKRMRIGGRAINPDETYLVAYTESVAQLPELESLLRDRESAVDDKPPQLHDVVFRVLDAHKNSPALFDFFLDHHDVIVDRTTAGFDDLALSGSALLNSDNAPTYAGARETRVSTPNLYQLGVHANAFFLYDGSWIANEWRLLAYLDGVYINIPHLNIPPQETRDDLVLSSELRINKLKIGIGTDDFQAIPFVQIAADSELTPTPLAATDPTLPLVYHPHQALLREEAGLVAYPGPIIRELRVGLVVQHDLSEVLDPKPALHEATGLHNDAGIVLGYKLAIPLFWRLRYDTTLDLRYFVPDGDDR
ncbi:MAG TPA: hypothetical protein VGO62_20100, partial [Myxococcota bacterium]